MVSSSPPGLVSNKLTSCRRFSGDESFEPIQLDAGSGLGVVIEGKKKLGHLSTPSRL